MLTTIIMLIYAQHARHDPPHTHHTHHLYASHHFISSIIQVASVRLTVAFIGRGPLVKANVVPWLTISSHFPGPALDESKHGHRFVVPRDPHAWLSSP